MIYLLVIDVSKPVEFQKQQVEYWISYLKSHIDSKDLSIIVVGNQLDKITDKNTEKEVVNYLNELKGAMIFDYTLLSAKKVLQVDNLISIMQKRCNSLDKTKFTIPKLYKVTAEILQNGKVPFLMGINKFTS